MRFLAAFLSVYICTDFENHELATIHRIGTLLSDIINFLIIHFGWFCTEAGFYLDEKEAPHGRFVGSIDNPPALIEDNLEYDFAGWYYSFIQSNKDL